MGYFIISHISLIIFNLTTDMNCVLMLNARGAETICLHMNEADASGQVLFRSSEILWNLLERGSKEEVTAQLSSMECVMYVSPVGLRCIHVTRTVRKENQLACRVHFIERPFIHQNIS